MQALPGHEGVHALSILITVNENVPFRARKPENAAGGTTDERRTLLCAGAIDSVSETSIDCDYGKLTVSVCKLTVNFSFDL